MLIIDFFSRASCWPATPAGQIASIPCMAELHGQLYDTSSKIYISYGIFYNYGIVCWLKVISSITLNITMLMYGYVFLVVRIQNGTLVLFPICTPLD